MTLSGENLFSILLHKCLFSRKEIYLDGLGCIKLVTNGSMLHGKQLAPPSFSLSWYHLDEYEELEKTRKAQAMSDYFVQFGHFLSKNKIDNHMSRMIKRLKSELATDAVGKIDQICSIHRVGQFFYVMPHPFLLPSFPRLNATLIATPLSEHSATTFVPPAPPMSPPIRKPHPVSPPVSLPHHLQKRPLPSTVYPSPEKTHPLPFPPSAQQKPATHPPAPPANIQGHPPQMSSASEKRNHQEIRSGKASKNSPLKPEVYILVSLLVLCVVVLIVYFSVIKNTNLLGSIFK